MPPSADAEAQSVEDLELDESKLQASASADRGDLFLLNWLSAAEKAVETLPEVSRPSTGIGGFRDAVFELGRHPEDGQMDVGWLERQA